MTDKSHPERLSQVSDRPAGDDNNLLNFIASTVEMILDRMATRDDISRPDLKIDGVEARLDARIDGFGARLSEKIGVGITAVRGDIEQVHLRLNSIERALTSRLGNVEAEVSRLRSVLYLLVRDDPAVLRMLGQVPPAGG